MIRFKVIRFKPLLILFIVSGIVAFSLGLCRCTAAQDKDSEGFDSMLQYFCSEIISPNRLSSMLLSSQLPAFEMHILEPEAETKHVFANSAGTVEAEENEHTDQVSEEADKIIIQLPDAQPITNDSDSPQINQNLGEAKILIYHTHTREAYKQTEGDFYVEPKSEPYRCDDFDYTVVKVGGVLTQELENRGVCVIHDTTEHEQEDLGTAYTRSLVTVQKYVNDNPELSLLIDLHRDAYNEGSKKADNQILMVDGEKVAKFFVLIGTGEGKTVGFSERPDWEKNYQTAQAITTIANELYPGIAEDVLVKTGRYNQHVMNNMILIEVGSNYTTLKEAERTAVILGEVIEQWLKTMGGEH